MDAPRPPPRPLTLSSVALALGLAMAAVGLLLAIFGTLGIMASGCETPPPGPADTGCQWSSPPGIFVVEGVGLFLVGLPVSLSATFSGRRKKAALRPPVAT
ncbi:MAG: hypothetical protein WB789_10005 [Thermoplasmata archaeon]